MNPSDASPLAIDLGSGRESPAEVLSVLRANDLELPRVATAIQGANRQTTRRTHPSSTSPTAARLVAGGAPPFGRLSPTIRLTLDRPPSRHPPTRHAAGEDSGRDPRYR